MCIHSKLNNSIRNLKIFAATASYLADPLDYCSFRATFWQPVNILDLANQLQTTLAKLLEEDMKFITLVALHAFNCV